MAIFIADFAKYHPDAYTRTMGFMQDLTGFMTDVKAFSDEIDKTKQEVVKTLINSADDTEKTLTDTKAVITATVQDVGKDLKQSANFISDTVIAADSNTDDTPGDDQPSTKPQ
jgi:hypothetical protein